MADNSLISAGSPIKMDKMIYVYYSPKPTIKVCLKFKREEVDSLNLSQLIEKCIKCLSDDYLLPINMSKCSYCLFPANRTGCKKDGYPEFDVKLEVSKLNIRRLFLQENNKSFSLISTEFNLERKYGMEKKTHHYNQCCNIFMALKA